MHRTNLSKHLHGLFILICVICLFPLFPTVAEGQYLALLTGTWNFNSFVSGPSAPWWERGTLTVAQDGTFSGSGTESNGNVDSLAGSFSVSSNEIVMTLNGQSVTPLCQIDSSNTFLSCTETLSNGSSYLMIMTQQAASPTLADLAGTWEGNLLFSGPSPLWERVSETINSDGTFTGSYTKSDGTTGSISGAFAISSAGEITCVSGDCVDPTYASFLNTGETVTVGTSGAATTAEDAGLLVFTEQTTSYSINNLVGTWQGNGLASGPGAPWWENDTLTINQDGTCSFVWAASNGSSGGENGTVSISSDGVITLNLGSTASGVIDANMTVMVFTNTWSDGVTQEIKIFTNGTAAAVNTATILASSGGSAPVTAGFSQATDSSTAPASNTGVPAATNNVLSNIGGGTTAQAGGIATTGSSQTNSTANTPVTATNAIETSPIPSSPSNSVAPATVPDAPTMVAANAGYSEASVSFKLPTNGGGQITGCTVTANPGGITATGVGSPITVSSLSNGTAYTFTVTAANKIGTGPPSDASNSVTPATVPDAPAILTAEADNSEAKVSFEAPASDGGSNITSYTVTSSSGQTASGPASPITVKGLTNGTPYTFTVTATNKIGTGPPSDSSYSVTPATVPDAPTIVRAKADKAEAKVSFKAPASNGGSQITSYTVTSSAGQTASGPASPITVKGLTNGTPYTFTVTATNKIGTGPPSSGSNSVMPR
jgi:large repetitive protein